MRTAENHSQGQAAENLNQSSQERTETLGE